MHRRMFRIVSWHCNSIKGINQKTTLKDVIRKGEFIWRVHADQRVKVCVEVLAHLGAVPAAQGNASFVQVHVLEVAQEGVRVAETIALVVALRFVVAVQEHVETHVEVLV